MTGWLPSKLLQLSSNDVHLPLSSGIEEPDKKEAIKQLISRI